MREGISTFKYLGVLQFLLTAFLIIFGSGYVYVIISLMLFMLFSLSYFGSFDSDFKKEYWNYLTAWIFVWFTGFSFWLGIGALCIFWIFFEFLLFLFRYSNPVKTGGQVLWAFVLAGLLLALYMGIM